MQSLIPLSLIALGGICEALLEEACARHSVDMRQLKLLLTLHAFVSAEEAGEGVVRKGTGMPVSELAAAVHMERSKVSRELKALKELGYVELGSVGLRTSGYSLRRAGRMLVSQLSADVALVDKVIRHGIKDEDARYLGSHLEDMVKYMPRSLPKTKEEWWRLSDRKMHRSRKWRTI